MVLHMVILKRNSREVNNLYRRLKRHLRVTFVILSIVEKEFRFQKDIARERTNE